MENTFTADNSGALAGAIDNIDTTENTNFQSSSATESKSKATKKADGFDSKEVQRTFSDRLNKEREKIKSELNQQYKHHNTMFDTLRKMSGNENISPEELSSILANQSWNLTGEEQSDSQIDRVSELERLVQTHPKMVQALAAQEKAEDMIRDNIFKSDLEEIIKAFPDVKVSSVFDLGETYVSIMQTGKVDPVAAYAATVQMQNMGRKEKPASMGGVKSGSAAQKEYYSPDEVDRLPKSAYDNPKVMDRIRRSMPKWNKS